jgi:DNA-binding transcriptional ArsR family regulator
MPDEKLARALSSRIRRKILEVLLDKELSVHLIAKKFGLSEVNSSKHLKKLYDLGLLKSRTDGRERLYKVKIPQIRQLLDSFDKVSKKL